jgi:hypothetical protein
MSLAVLGRFFQMINFWVTSPTTVIPAQAGTQLSSPASLSKLDSRLRGNGGIRVISERAAA